MPSPNPSRKREGDLRSELQTLHRLHSGKLAELPQQRLGHRRIEAEQQYRFAARAAAAEVEGADVEAGFAERGADAANETRRVLVDDIEHMAVEIGFDLRSEEHTSALQSLMRHP